MDILASVTLLVNPDGVIFEIGDEKAGVQILSIDISQSDFMSLLGRDRYVKMNAKIANLDKVGKKMEVDSFEFELPVEASGYELRKKWAIENVQNALIAAGKSDWEADKYYGSQKSFFTKDGKPFARATIRRWI